MRIDRGTVTMPTATGGHAVILVPGAAASALVGIGWPAVSAGGLDHWRRADRASPRPGARGATWRRAPA
jgi:hypothetical protein